MGLNFRKSFKIGAARINLSKSGVGYSVGANGVRYTKSPKRRTKKKVTLMGAVLRIFGVVLAGFLVLAAAAAVYTLATRFKWVFIAIGVLLLAGLIAYFVVRNHKSKQPEETDCDQVDPVP